MADTIKEEALAPETGAPKKEGEDTTSNGSISPGRPESAHGQTPEGSDGDDSKDKWESTEGISQELLEEEKKMAAINQKAEEDMRKKLEERDRDEKQLQEKRYKRLMHLLNKSEFYSQFLLKQIEAQESENKQKRSKKTTDSEESSSQESVGKGKKRKGKGAGPPSKRHLVEGKYKIGDVINSDMVKANAAAQEEPEEVVRAEQPSLFINGVMRPYQLDGLSWLTALYENGVNGILGDEMGLGKTIQCIALVCHLVNRGVPGPFLIIGPLSTLPNWMAEFARFAPAVPTVLYHGMENTRKERRKALLKTQNVEGTPHFIYPVMITSYEVIVRDTKILNKFHWRYICVDEGHRLKNHKCQLVQSLKTFPSTNRLLMTGTPLQNDLSELWSLLNFLMPEIFDSLDIFESWFDVTEMMEDGSNKKIVKQEREKQVIKTLMKILSPFFLRRMKKDVDLDLPPKKELLVYTPMTPLQVELYEATLKLDIAKFDKMKAEAVKKEQEIKYDERGRPIRKSKKSVDYSVFGDSNETAKSPGQGFNKYIESLLKMEEDSAQVVKQVIKKTAQMNIKLQNRMMQLRRVVNHPYLLAYPLLEDGLTFKVDDGLVKTCGKLQVLDQLLGELYKRGHRVLIFSQMTMMMDIIEDYLTLRPKYTYKRLDGSRSLEERQVDINDFNSDDSIFTFLISTRAGSLGINLASADTVIIYDSDWNPQCDLQAQDRCHRIGQTKPVLVLRLITSSTVDERIVDRAATKRKLEKMIIQNGKFTTGNAKLREKELEKCLSIEELELLLQERDHDRAHNTKDGNIFSKAELDELLDRSDLVLSKDTPPSPTKSQIKGVFKVVKQEEEESV